MSTSTQLEAEAAELEAKAKRLRGEAFALRQAERQHAMTEAAKVPVDRSARVLTDGNPVPEDGSHTEPGPSGQQKAYVVLTAEERAKGFVRPVRTAYRHTKCDVITTMSRDIAETYARDPYFYSGTWCTGCGGHHPVGENGKFVWIEADGSEGPKVGT